MKIFNYWYLSLVVLLSLGSHSCAQNKATIDIKEDEKLIEFTTDRFTLPNLHVTPDGKYIVFDVLGDIYQVPIEGGEAEVLLKDNHWKRGAKLSPDGKTLAYVSDETGDFKVWTYNLQTKFKQVYPLKENRHFPLYGYWGCSGNLFIPSVEGLFSYNISTGDEVLVRPAKEEEKSILHTVNRSMTIGKAGTHAYFQNDNAIWAYPISEKNDQFISNIEKENRFITHQVGPSGDILLYYRKSIDNADFLELMYWNLETNVKKLLWSTKTLGSATSLNYSFDFIDDKTIILDKEGEVVRMKIETGMYERIPIEVNVKKVIKKPLRREPQYIKDSIITASVLRNPITRKNLDTIYFGAFGKLHTYTKQTQEITEIHPEEDRFEVSPSLSPDGKYLAYTTWNDTEMGYVYVRELETGREYQLTAIPGRYINPAWSPDGTELVFVSDETEAKMGVPRQSGGTNTSNYYLDIHRISVVHQGRVITAKKLDVIRRITPISIVPRRFYPIPVYHPSGNSIYISTRNKEKDLPTLIEIDLISKEIINELLIPFHTDEVLISPDAKHIAFIYDEQVWIDTYPYSTILKFSPESNFIPKKFHYKGGMVDNILLPNAKSIYEIAPSYLSWQDVYTLMWGAAEEVYTYDVRNGRTEKITAIKIRRARATPKGNYALTNANIITINKEDEIIENGTILIKGNRIKLVGKYNEVEIPDNYKTYDLKGKTIIPGLIDVHAHYHHFPYEFQVQQNFKYIGNLAYGVTTIYDPSVNVLDYRERAQMVETGQIIGPRVFASGNIIDHYPAVYDYRTIQSYLDTDRILSSNKKLNVHSPLKQYNLKNRKHRKLLYNSAKKYKLTLTNHETEFLSAITQIIDGYTSMEHEKYTFSIQKDIIQLIAQSKINYSPTFMVSPGIKDVYVTVTKTDEKKLLSLNGSILYRNHYKYFETYKKKNKIDFENWSNTAITEHTRASASLRKIVNAGGKISVGGHGNPLPGIGTHWELWFMTKGMSKYKALQSATINGAEKIDLQEEIGSIEEGKLADLVVLNSNPLESIFNTTDILYTIQNGSIYEAETMNQIHPIEKELQFWGWDSSKVLKSMQNINMK